MSPEIVEYFCIFVLSYILGSIPFGLLLTRVFSHQDIRDIGSGNIGATNVLRTGYKGLAALTLICDAGKGALCVFIANFLFPDLTHLTGSFALLGSVLGHIFPPWLKFKGGKGVATLAGATLVLFPLIGIIALAIWVGVFIFTRISSFSALTSIGAVSILVFLIYPCLQTKCFLGALLFLSACLLVIWRHKDNIHRLLKSQEKAFK